MSIHDEFDREMRASDGGRSLGEAANRYVTFQIVMAIIGLGVFLFMLFFFFVPMWNSFPMP